MKVVGTFNPTMLRGQSNTVQKNSGFAAMLAFNLDSKPGKDDVTALFAANSSELKRLYEQTTGKSLDGQAENKTIVVTFCNRVIPRNYWAAEFLDNSENDAQEDWKMPFRHLPSNHQNMKCAVR